MFTLKPAWLKPAFWTTLGLACLTLTLRGFALLTFMPGGLISLLWIAAISLGIYLAIVSLR